MLTRKTTAAAVAATLLIGTPAVAAAATPRTTPDSRTVASTCGRSVNPNTYFRPGMRHAGPSAWIGSTRIQLRYGNRPGGPRYYWATITHASRGNKVTLYWDIDHGGSWRDSGACSATVHSGGAQNTRAVKAVYGNGFHLEAEACGHHAGRTRCTASLP
ncbi:hypothetical protein ACFY0F_28985 [Streptomyces sp. NPDC001544]|uniref:hypothetical protein n=1 Tax=Streptomyces sp. NPDC001544 TaxID=3364584 RepID=UPI0036875427